MPIDLSGARATSKTRSPRRPGPCSADEATASIPHHRPRPPHYRHRRSRRHGLREDRVQASSGETTPPGPITACTIDPHRHTRTRRPSHRQYSPPPSSPAALPAPPIRRPGLREDCGRVASGESHSTGTSSPPHSRHHRSGLPCPALVGEAIAGLVHRRRRSPDRRRRLGSCRAGLSPLPEGPPRGR